MTILFYIGAALAALSTVAAVTRQNIVHASLWLNASFLAVSMVFYSLGAPFAAMLEVITYAGAIMVLFIFAIMLMGPGPDAINKERRWRPRLSWTAPLAVSMLLLTGFIIAILAGTQGKIAGHPIGPVVVGVSLFSTYALGVELASIFLLAALIGAFYLGRQNAASDGDKQ
jgi:NADH-quinone oxidoreductase subunit J